MFQLGPEYENCFLCEVLSTYIYKTENSYVSIFSHKKCLKYVYCIEN
jgi:hypothetical protein